MIQRTVFEKAKLSRTNKKVLRKTLLFYFLASFAKTLPYYPVEAGQLKILRFSGKQNLQKRAHASFFVALIFIY